MTEEEAAEADLREKTWHADYHKSTMENITKEELVEHKDKVSTYNVQRGDCFRQLGTTSGRWTQKELKSKGLWPDWENVTDDELVQLRKKISGEQKARG